MGDEARKVGLREADMVDAELIHHEQMQIEQRRALRQAITRGDRQGLRQAIAASRSAGFLGEELAQAENALREARFAKHRADIAKAVKSQNKALLYRAVVEARSA